MARAFKNPTNGNVEIVGVRGAVAVLLFGGLYILYCGLWGHLALWVSTSIAVSSLSKSPEAWLVFPVMRIIYAMCINGILVRDYQEQGWIEVPLEAARKNAESINNDQLADDVETQ